MHKKPIEDAFSSNKLTRVVIGGDHHRDRIGGHAKLMANYFEERGVHGTLNASVSRNRGFVGFPGQVICSGHTRSSVSVRARPNGRETSHAFRVSPEGDCNFSPLEIFLRCNEEVPLIKVDNPERKIDPMINGDDNAITVEKVGIPMMHDVSEETPHEAQADEPLLPKEAKWNDIMDRFRKPEEVAFALAEIIDRSGENDYIRGQEILQIVLELAGFSYEVKENRSMATKVAAKVFRNHSPKAKKYLVTVNRQYWGSYLLTQDGADLLESNGFEVPEKFLRKNQASEASEILFKGNEEEGEQTLQIVTSIAEKKIEELRFSISELESRENELRAELVGIDISKGALNAKIEVIKEKLVALEELQALLA